MKWAAYVARFGKVTAEEKRKEKVLSDKRRKRKKQLV
jgi:hypothetical protein